MNLTNIHEPKIQTCSQKENKANTQIFIVYMTTEDTQLSVFPFTQSYENTQVYQNKQNTIKI